MAAAPASWAGGQDPAYRPPPADGAHAAEVRVRTEVVAKLELLLDTRAESAKSAPRWGDVGCGGLCWRQVVEQTDGWDEAPRVAGCSADTSLTRWTTRGGWRSRPASARCSPGSRRSASSSPSTACEA